MLRIGSKYLNYCQNNLLIQSQRRFLVVCANRITSNVNDNCVTGGEIVRIKINKSYSVSHSFHRRRLFHSTTVDGSIIVMDQLTNISDSEEAPFAGISKDNLKNGSFSGDLIIDLSVLHPDMFVTEYKLFVKQHIQALSKEQLLELNNILVNMIPQLTPKNLSTLVYALHWKVSKFVLEEEVKSTFEHALLKCLPLMTVVEFLHAMEGMRRNNLNFNPEHRTVITDTFVTLLNSLPKTDENFSDLTFLLIGYSYADFRFYEQSPELQQAILEAIPTNLSAMETRRVFRLLKGVSGLRIPLNNFPKSTQISLLESLVVRHPWFDSNFDIAKLLLRLESMDVQWTDLSPEARGVIDCALSAVSYSDRRVLKMFLIAMNIRFADLSPATQTSLVSKLTMRSYMMGVQWSELSLDARNAIDVGFQDTKTHKDLKHVALMGVEWRDLSPAARNKLIIKINDWFSELSGARFLDLIRSCAEIKVPLSIFTSEARQALQARLVLLLSQYDRIYLSDALYSLAVLGMRWSDMSSALKQAVSDSLLRTRLAYPTAAKDVVTLELSTMARLGFEWSHVVPELRSAILSDISRAFTGSLYLDKDIFRLLTNLTRLNVEWSELEPAVRDSLMASLSSDQNADFEHVMKTIKVLGKLGAESSQLLLSLEAALMKRLGTSNDLEMVLVMRGLVGMDVEWVALQSETQEALLKRVMTISNDKSITGAVAHSLAVLTFDIEESDSLRDAHQMLTQHILDTSCNGSPLSQLGAVYLEWRDISTTGGLNLHEFPGLMKANRPIPVQNRKLKIELSTAARRHFSCDVIQGATKLQFGGVYFDYVIQRHGVVIAFILLDDDDCYRTDGTLRRSAQLLDRLHQVRYPEVFVYRMRRDEVERLGEAAAAEMLLGAILEDVAILDSSKREYF